MEQVERICPFDSVRLRQSGIISDAEFAKFRYYEIDHILETGHHDVIGVWEERDNPLLLHVRLMHILRDVFQMWPEYRPSQGGLAESAVGSLDELSDIEAGLHCTLSELQAVIKFFTQWAGSPPATEVDPSNHFQLLEPPMPGQLWTTVRAAEQLYLFDPTYRYSPSATIPHYNDLVATVSLPGWAQRVSQDQVGCIHFFVFRRFDLKNPAFDPYVTYGLGVIPFDRPALRGLIAILARTVQ